MDLNSKNISEIIANHIINKIISLTISKALKIKTDNNMANNCFQYAKKTINNILSSYYIFYDKDELKDNENKINKSFFKSDIEIIQKINNSENQNINTNLLENFKDETDMILQNYFFNNIYEEEENDWNLIDEPKPIIMDRYSSSLITFKEINKIIDGGKYKINHEGIKEVEENENDEYNEINKNKTNKTLTIIEKDKDKEIIKNYIAKKAQKKTKNETKQKIKDIANQFECYDLEPEENNQILEINQINQLREQFEQKKKFKSLEQKNIPEGKEKIVNIQKINEQNNRKYIGKNITKDHNGEIIFIKRIKPDKFKNDFIFGKTKLKAIINNENNQKKKIINNESKNIGKTNLEENLQNKDFENNIKKLSKKISIKSLPKLESVKVKMPFSTIEVQDKNDEIKAISVKRRFPIITSGSNFNLMNMEIGVSLKEDEKFKTGGLDFVSKFKKFSLKAYNKKLKEAESINELKKNIEIIEEPKSHTIEEMNNIYTPNYTMGYSTNNFGSTITESNNFRNMNKVMFSTNNSSMLNHYLKNINDNNLKENSHKYNSFNPFIQLTMGASSSLIGSLDKLNLVPNEEEKRHKKRKNIFRETNINTLRKENKLYLDEINLFTKNLITNKKNDLKRETEMKMRTIGGIRNPEKPNMREIIKEIGLKGKLMRNRSKIIVPIKSNYIETENFFKQ